MKTIAVLMTVHNRKEKTLRCLASLYGQKYDMSNYCLDVYLTNDGCTDGTPDAIRQTFPDVHIVEGDGSLYWNGGMRRAWIEAAKGDYDYYLWLNDDVVLLPDALKELLETPCHYNGKSIMIGAMRDNVNSQTTYGGFSITKRKLLDPNGELQECQTMHGNCVLIPKFVYNNCGILDRHFHHAIGDLDYGLRARKDGIKLYLCKNYIGICEGNQTLPLWTNPKTPFLKRCKILYSPLGYAEPIPFFIFEYRHFNVFVAVKHFILIHIRLLFPFLWKH